MLFFCFFVRFFVSQAGRGGGAGVLGGGWAEEGWQTKSPQLGWRREGEEKKTNDILITFFHVGCGAPIYEKVRGPMAERAHLPFVAE